MTENNFLSLIIFAPLLGAVINWLIGGRLKSELFSGAVACSAVGVSCVVAFMIAFGIGTPHEGALAGNRPILDQIWTWIQVGGFRADFGLGIDRLSGIYVCFVTFVGLLIHIFATGYMHGDKSFYRFFAYLNLFMFAMLTLILADNYLLMFVGWEGVGLCSYLLIGYYVKRDEARKAAKKAFVMNRIGDWGVLMGIFLIFTTTGSISFYDKTIDGAQVQSVFTWVSQNVAAAEPFTWGAIFAGGLTTIGVLLFIGACGKSAQIPLFTWLPDAMAGPTPVPLSFTRRRWLRRAFIWSCARTRFISFRRRRCGLSPLSARRRRFLPRRLPSRRTILKKFSLIRPSRSSVICF
jgi:NADH-quinone oxidoreductase subunit L